MRQLLIWLVGASLLTTSCGQDPSSELQGIEQDKQQRPVLIISGGNSSCERDDNKEFTPRRMGMYPKFAELEQQTRDNGVDMDYILTCYRDYQDTFDVHYIFSDDPETVHVADREDFYVDAGQFFDAAAPGPLLMAGHSYGGWLAMRAVVDLERDFSAVFTLDAISQVECRFSRPFGCTSAPADIDGEERNIIAERSGTWLNYYQTNTFYLHSSSINHADANFKISTSHNAIKTRDEVWQAITEKTYEVAEAETPETLLSAN